MRGRKPKPTRQRVLEGNPGKRRLPRDEVIPPPLVDQAAPELAPAAPAVDPFDAPPPELDDNPLAITEWKRLAPMLHRLRLVTEADRGPLMAICLEWSRYIDANKKVAKLGMVIKAPSGYPMPNPYLSISKAALASCAKLWPELGLTPSSRARVTPATTEPPRDAFSEFDRPLAEDDVPTTEH